MIGHTHVSQPLVAHLIHRLATGGLENGLVNLINRMPRERYRHAVICLTDASSFKARLTRSDVEIHELGLRAGLNAAGYYKLYKALRHLRPDILHTRNIGTLEGQVCAMAAGVPGRVHGEHGRDESTVMAAPLRYRLLRAAIHPLIGAYTSVSRYGATAITEVLPTATVVPIYNGVDASLFLGRTTPPGRTAALPECLRDPNIIIIGAIGRLEPVKDPATAILSLKMIVNGRPELRSRVRLAIVGDGTLYSRLLDLTRTEELAGNVWFAGDRSDVPALLKTFDIFVQSSLTEGLSNTLLEAMATGLPIVATQVGGNAELIPTGCGTLVKVSDPETIANAVLRYIDDPELALSHARAAQKRVQNTFGIDVMVNEYLRLYDSVI